MTTDYTREQPIVDSLQDSLDERLGVGRAGLGRLFVPKDADEVALAVGAADAFGARIAVGEPPPDRLGIDLTALRTTHEIDALSQLVTVGFGVTPAELEVQLATQGLALAPLWFADPLAPIGEALARGEAAPLAFAVSAVLPDGTLFRTPYAPRRASGPAPEALVLGQNHRFALLVSATLRVASRVALAQGRRLVGSAASVLELARTLARNEFPWLGACVTSTADSGMCELTIQCEAAALAHLPDHLSDGQLPGALPPGPARWQSWSQLRVRLEAGETLVAAPLDRHGGWVRGEATPGSAVLDAIARHLDPHSTLEPA